VAASSALTQTLQQLTAKRADLAALGATYTDEHRAVRQAREELAVLERRSLPALTGTLLSELGAREATLDRLLGTATGELRQIPARAIEDARLARQAEISENLYRVLQQRSDEARIAAATTVPDVRVLDPPSASRGLGGSSPVMILLLFVLGSGAVGIAVALTLDRLGTRIVYPDQVSHEMGLSVLATIPNVNRIGRLGPVAATAQAMEAFRVARVNLLFAHGTAGPLILAISSPSAGDGKSFVSAHLARAFAESGQRTLLIDGDTRRGTLHRQFGLNRRPGLTDHLGGSATVHEVVQRTGLETLDFVGCGMRTRDAPALLGSGVLARMVNGLKGDYDVILMDTPPFAAGVDPLIFGTVARDLLVVLRAGPRSGRWWARCSTCWTGSRCGSWGAVLNDVSEAGVYQYYGYLPSYQAHDEAAGPEVRRLQPS
jgi:capsular exopolysaccharide synthesis family protein